MSSQATPSWDPNVTLKLTDGASPVRPREHQVAAWDRMNAHYVDGAGKAGIIVVPTGGGKTLLAAHWLLQNHVKNGGRVLWLAHRRSLLRQAMSTFRRLGNVAFPKPRLSLATISSSDARWPSISSEHDVVCSSMQTAVLEGNIGFVHEFVEGAKGGVFVVVDEAHHAPAPSYARLLRSLREWGARLIGLTATPVKSKEDDAKRLSALFDQKVVYQVTRRELTERGILAAPSFETVKTQVNLEKDFTAEDFKYLERYGEIGPNVLQRLAKNAHRNALIVEHYKQGRDKFGPTIVFAADTLHAQTLSEELKKAGISADHVDYSRKDAQEIIERYRNERKPDVLVNVEMLTEGFDAPHTRTVFIARPTRSEGLLSQMVGRALRGKQSGGNDIAYLVTFLDTWEQFNVVDAEYVLRDAEDVVAPDGPGAPDPDMVIIPPELVREAYRMLQSNVRGQFTGVFQCLPHSWYAWNQTFDDDFQRRSVMVFDNQSAGYAALMAAFADRSTIPAEISEDVARALVQRFFGDIPDPLPRWADVKALLDAKRNGEEVEHYTFAEKKAFDPADQARKIMTEQMTPSQEQAHLQRMWDEQPVCRNVYRDDFRSFLEDVSHEVLLLRAPASTVRLPEVETILPTAAPRAWPAGERGYSLVGLRDSVLAVKRHFPKGAPLIADLRWSEQPTRSLWGFFRYSDKTITINCVLQSPDIPYFVLEYLMFHEMLHADMPSAGHNREFRDRERLYAPSTEALEDAKKRGIGPRSEANRQFWYVAADRFLGTYDRYYLHKTPGTTMELG